MRLQQVTTHHASVASAKHRVDMQARAAVGDGDVADQRENLDLLVDRYLPVALGLPIEITENRVAEGADRGERSSVDLLRGEETGQSLDDFLIGLSSPTA